MSLDTSSNLRDHHLTTVQWLNARYELGLPEVIERIVILDDKKKALQRECAKCIKILSLRQDYKFTRLLEDCDDALSVSSSQWIFKPSQAKGTLSDMPISKSFIRRDNVSKIDTQVDSEAGTSSEHLENLLTSLLRILLDEVKLVQQSDTYITTKGPSSHRNSDQGDLHRPNVTPKRERPIDIMSPSVSTKRRKSDQGSSSTKQTGSRRIKDEPPTNQRTIQAFMTPLQPTPMPSNTTATTAFPSNIASFESIISPPPSLVFDTSFQNGQNSSNETSILVEDDKPQIQYGLIQEISEGFQDAPLKESPKDADTPTDDTSRLLQELKNSGPWRKPDTGEIIQQSLSFRCRYECYRLAQRLSMTPPRFYKELVKTCETEDPGYEAFWAAAKAISSRPGLEKLGASEKSSVMAWDSAQAEFKTTDEKSVVLSGALEWSGAKQPGIFICKLNPMRLERSCRFERKFGADRFMYMAIPCISSDAPKDSRGLSAKAKELHTAVARWLGTTTHFIAGRYWRAFFVDEVKKKKQPKSFRVYMFATDGAGFSPLRAYAGLVGGESCESRVPLGIAKLIDWYMPLHSNLDAKDKKYFQRLSLGFSRTSPTIVLEQKEFVHLPRNKNWTGKVMNDGCARMSRALANKICEKLGLESSPSVFQGRISGAKGLWMVENNEKLYPDACKGRGYWLEVTDEQLKIKPHPMHRLADPEHRTFEVLKCTSTPKVASMNIQLMGILSHGGVHRDELEKRLRGNTRGYHDDLVTAMKDPRDLRLWIHQHENTSRDREIAMLGAMPRNFMEQVNFLLETGFNPEDNEVIVSRLRSCLTKYLETYIERLQIKIDMSTSVWCVPDPYGLLEPGEVHMSFSQPWKGPNGCPITSLHGLEVLVYRSPGYLPSDAQRVKGVLKPQLSHLLDVIVFSTQGEVPLAHKLSGGDYDGDTCWVCFDQDIVTSFKKDNDPPAPVAEGSLGLKNKSQPLSNHFKSGTPSALETGNFLTECFSFNLVAPMLGFCSTEHEMLSYHKHDGLADEKVMRLAALVGYLVDAPKQGYFLSRQAWSELKKDLCGTVSLKMPAYKNGSETKPRPDQSIIDYLKLVVAEEERTEILRDFSKAWPEGSRYDKPLTMSFRNAETKYEEDGDNSGQRILQQLKKDVDTFKTTWNSQLAICKNEQFDNAVAAMHADVRLITPLAEREHEIYKRYIEEETQEFGSWSRMRAACLYYRWNKGIGPWYAVGTDLARMRADATPNTRVMVSCMHNMMKPDGRLVLRTAERAKQELEEEDDDDDMLDGGEDEDY